MKLNKIKISIIVASFTFMGITVGSLTSNHVNNNKLYNGKPLYSSSAMLMYDTSTPEKAIGISDYVFVAKINKVLRTEYRNRMQVETGIKQYTTVSNPYTVYEINVIENIKGNLKTDEPIEFMQYGGINEDGQSYTFMEGGELLKNGDYYLLMVDTWGDQNGGTIETSDVNRIISLGDYYNQNSRSNLVSQYKLAFKNQQIPDDLTTNEMSKFDINYQQ